MKQLLTINGIDAPLLHQFGCGCARCADNTRQANTSVSLLTVADNGRTIHHILVDIGSGVVESMRRNPYLAGERARLDWLLLTHWHPDHTLEMNRLLSAYDANRRRRGLPAGKVPVWCRRGTADWLAHEHAYDWQTYLRPYVCEEGASPGRVLPPVPLEAPNWIVTPVAVGHYGADVAVHDRRQVAYSCAAFVVETAVTKTILLWDIDSENSWLWQPQGEEEETAVAALSHANYLLIDTTFWRSPTNRRMTHPGFDQVQRIVRRLQPKETLLTHLSGHPDGPGNPGYGWTNAEWEAAGQQVWREQKLPGRVHVPAIGDEFLLG